MSIFAPQIVTALNQLGHIDNAYSTAGVAIPNRAVPFARLVNSAPSVSDVALKVAQSAITDTRDPEVTYREAIAQVTEAVAADALRRSFAEVQTTVERDNIPALIDQAARDLAPRVTKTVTTLANAAAKLRPDAPLDMQAAVEDDTTKEWKIAQDALRELAIYAAIHLTRIGGPVPAGGINALIPILDIPTCEVEILARVGIVATQTTNAQDAHGTFTVRTIDSDAREDIDATLIRVALGQYDDTTIALADHTTHYERWSNLRNAFTTKTVDAGGTLVMR